MKETVLKVALAGLTHDIGKFAQGGMMVSAKYKNDNAGQYQPFYNNNHTHVHSLYTAAFIEQFADVLPSVLNRAGWGKGDAFINLAAGHHKPETAMQECVTVADRLSSGLDRANFSDQTHIPFTQYRSTRLLSVLEALAPDGEQRQEDFEQSDSYTTHYPLKAISADTIFPVQCSKINKSTAQQEYQKLFDDFAGRLRELPHRTKPSLWAQHFDSLLATYTSHIPAARVGGVIPDVSLYDHCRTTAALAAPLYIYHKEAGTLDKGAIHDHEPEKFLLVSGDFYGIQDFIFASGGEQQRLRAKILRGRSFAVSLFSELAADALCRALDLPFTAVFLNAAGKFHLLAANTVRAREVVAEKIEELNTWLFNISYGQASLGVTITPAAGRSFTQGEFSRLWDEHLQTMSRRKYQRLPIAGYGVVDTFLSSFDNSLTAPLCPFCGKRPSDKRAKRDHWLDGDGESCAVCRDHIMLGANLVKGKQLAIYGNINGQKGKHILLEPVFNKYQLMFVDDSSEIDQDNLFHLWQLGVQKDGTIPAGGTCRLLNGYIPVYTENALKSRDLLDVLEKDEERTSLDELVKNQVPLTFNAIAAMAKNEGRGTAALGVLKADVDHLGLLMSCGMARERFTISRMATLSRKLNQFFSLYLSHLLGSEEEFNTVYTVFAGGDDLFLIGPWNTMSRLAQKLRKKWHIYVSGNDQDKGLTFSAGISLHKTHEPMDKLAEIAEDALEQAKDAGRNRITMFGETVTWEEFDGLQEKRQIIADWVGSRDYLSRVMLYRFNTFINMAGKAKRITDGKSSVHVSDMECLKWPALLRYSLERNIRKKGKERDKAMQEVIVVKNWLEDDGEKLKIALWSHLYEQR